MAKRKPPEYPPRGNFEKKLPMTPTEERFFRILEEAFASAYYIFPKVALFEIVKNTHYEDFEYIGGKNIDFMLYDKTTFMPICAIELNDATHKRRNTREIDLVKQFLLSEADIPYAAIDVHEWFSPNKIRHTVMNTKITRMEYPLPLNDPVTVEVEEYDPEEE